MAVDPNRWLAPTLVTSMLMVLRPDDPPRSAPDPRVARAGAGDRQAAQALLTELLPRVRNLVRYLVRGDADADDIVQGVLVELLKSFAQYRGEGSLSAFCDRITVRVALHHVRKQRTDRKHTDAMGPELHLVAPRGEGPDEYTLRRQTARYLDELPDEQRQAVVLHHVLGQSVPELAQALDIPFETARSRLRLGMEKLRAKLAQRGAP